MHSFPHEIKMILVIHKMEPASQKETSPLDRFAINSLPHKSSAFVPQCKNMDLAYDNQHTYSYPANIYPNKMIAIRHNAITRSENHQHNKRNPSLLYFFEI